MPDVVQSQVNRFVKAEPALAASGAAAVVSYVLTQLVTLGVITNTQASLDTKIVLPPVTALFLLALGFVVRSVVRPAAGYLERIEAEVQAKISELFAANPELKAIQPLVQGSAGQSLLDQAKQELGKIQTELTPALESNVAWMKEIYDRPSPTPKPGIDDGVVSADDALAAADTPDEQPQSTVVDTPTEQAVVTPSSTAATTPSSS